MMPRIPQVPIFTATVLHKPVRMYGHPSVQHGFLWSSLADLAAVVGYPPEGQRRVVEQWQQFFPEKAATVGDGTVIVSESIASGFFVWSREMGWDQADQAILERDSQVNYAMCLTTGHLTSTAFHAALQRSILVDAVEAPNARSN